ncbi:HupE/UreJ family protein [Alisedimentitalea sp. MJ-SS2]|uniref:HupE/UreJ family protein n=1 Tax=Aliisedimentitalea sp. MJ-SS2 TaxID=3049795 RepID=UPI0029110029|nr:HupE/UreJ family protein [Alisedimentitalea sp. MJ-SS2]MDU8926941.1 HupE/UreJ family protein [Alisedimentitalea sp. MJ-SS2]
MIRMRGFITQVGPIMALLASVFLLTVPTPTRAHEVFPGLATVEARAGELHVAFEVTVEALMAGIDLSEFEDTNAAPQAADYEALRALPPAELNTRIANFAPYFLGHLLIAVDYVPLELGYDGAEIRDPNDPELARLTVLRFSAPLPEGARIMSLGWTRNFGALILRQKGDVPNSFSATLSGGDMSPDFALAGGSAQTGWQVFGSYVPIGFDHILPKGMDHILFVLGLFLLAARLRPLLWQVTAFTAAHTVTLALGALGWVVVPGSIVEPLIAASICYVAIENVFTDRLNRWRPLVVFGFGLLHGLGFASVLEEFGLPEAHFIPALLGFNVGVEFGQLTVIAIAFLLVGFWFRNRIWYRNRITVPASLLIAAIGAYWVVERTLL